MIPLSIRSNYSFMWGTASVKQLCRHARQMGYQQAALTDTDNLCGLWPFLAACKREGLTPVVGAEVTDKNTHDRAVCLVKNKAGYQNLCRLISRRHQDEGFDLKESLPLFSKGLVVLTKNPEHLEFWHGCSIDVAAHLPRKPLLRDHPLCRAAGRTGRPVVATPGSFFLNRTDVPIHRMLRAIDKNTCLSRLSQKDLVPDNAFFASPADYRQRFEIFPQALKETRILAERLEFRQPDFGIVMPPYPHEKQVTITRLLLEKAFEGARKRYGTNLPGKVIDRIHHELGIIEQKGFCQYFLVVQDIVKKSSRICGRGSGAASIIAYCLGITNVCPIKHNLYFERFLNPGRQDPPDIDIDFAWDERDQILEHVLEKFKGHAAMVSSHVLFQPRMAVREVARVYGLPEAEITKISKRLPWFWRQDDTDPDLLERIKKKPEFRFMEFPPPWPEIMQYAQAIIGAPRYLSVHPGGVVITPDPIDAYVPVQTATKGVPLMQWEKDATEDAGLVKIDLLGNRSLGVIRDAVNSVKKNYGIDTVFDQDPEDDYETQHNVALGNTMGCFYIESPAMRLLQKKSKVGDFEHVVIHSSIIRPAANEFIKEYIKRLHTGIWDPIHPLLKDTLNETFGIMVYQEDVSKVAMSLAGFSHVEADGLRKIMSKKDKEHVLKDYYETFKNGAQAKGVSIKEIDAIWDMITSFSGYSFCKPHSASYARVSFQAAFLKTHYPAEFMAGVISNQGGFYSTFAYVSEARRMQVEILPPDVNQSMISWQGNKDRLRVGLMAVKELSAPTMKKIILARKNGLFSSLEDFLSRIRPHENEARSLIHSGSLDVLNTSDNRSSLLWALTESLSGQGKSRQLQGQPSLFEELPKETARPELPLEIRIERLRREYAALGFLCQEHPIVLFKEMIQKENSVKAHRLPQFVGRAVKFAGWLLTGKSVKTKHGDPMKFLTFEDETGLVETVFFPKAYVRFCHMLDKGKPYVLYGRVDSEWGAVTLTVEQTKPLSIK